VLAVLRQEPAALLKFGVWVIRVGSTRSRRLLHVRSESGQVGRHRSKSASCQSRP